MKKTVELSRFGSELIDLRIAMEMTEDLRYKLRKFGITIDGPSEVFCDNKLVANSSSIPTSTLSKRRNVIFHYIVREA